MDINKDTRLKRSLGFTLLYLLIILNFFICCSHIKPYYREPFDPATKPTPEEKDLRYRLLFIGDAGAPEENDPVLEKLTHWASKSPQKTMVIFLGDNIYPAGMPKKRDSYRKEAEWRLQAQIDVIKKSGAQGFFIAGNHDWKKGLAGLLREERFVNQKLGRDDVFLPGDGCPGPKEIDVENIRIIAMDTYYWLNRKLKPGEGCPHKDLTSSLETLKTLLQTSGDREVVFVTHNPLDTHGVHGGFYDWRDHLIPLTRLVEWLYIPLPIIGSLYPLFRENIIKPHEDLSSPEYKDMIIQLKEAFVQKKPLIFAAGHDHSLQVLDGGEYVGYIIISGAGSRSKLSTVSHGENSIFAHLHEGFMAVDFFDDGRVWLYVIEPGEEEIVFSRELIK